MTAAAGARPKDRPARLLFRAGTPANRLLRFTLAVPTVAMTVVAFALLWLQHGPGVDLEIPLRAAGRWVNGGTPYVAESFQAAPGPDLPFLYPPFVLPFLTPLLALPRVAVLFGWVLLCAFAAVWACRRLRIPTIILLLVLAWPPFAEGIVGGNVQIILFALFVSLFWRADDTAPSFAPTPRDPTAPPPTADEPGDPRMTDLRRGTKAAAIAAFKVSQAHAWGYLLFRRPVAAVAGAIVVGLLVLVTLPITGIGVWGDWIGQVRRAADPDWLLAGIGLGRYVPPVVSIAVSIASVVLLAFVPRATAGIWVGVLGIVGAPSLHTFGLLFIVPAMLAIRREVAIVAAGLIATYTEPGMWIGLLLVIGTLVAGIRLPALREPVRPLPETMSAVDARGELVPAD